MYKNMPHSRKKMAKRKTMGGKPRTEQLRKNRMKRNRRTKKYTGGVLGIPNLGISDFIKWKRVQAPQPQPQPQPHEQAQDRQEEIHEKYAADSFFRKAREKLLHGELSKEQKDNIMDEVAQEMEKYNDGISFGEVRDVKLTEKVDPKVFKKYNNNYKYRFYLIPTEEKKETPVFYSMFGIVKNPNQKFSVSLIPYFPDKTTFNDEITWTAEPGQDDVLIKNSNDEYYVAAVGFTVEYESVTINKKTYSLYGTYDIHSKAKTEMNNNDTYTINKIFVEYDTPKHQIVLPTSLRKVLITVSLNQTMELSVFDSIAGELVVVDPIPVAVKT